MTPKEHIKYRSRVMHRGRHENLFREAKMYIWNLRNSHKVYLPCVLAMVTDRRHIENGTSADAVGGEGTKSIEVSLYDLRALSGQSIYNLDEPLFGRCRQIAQSLVDILGSENFDKNLKDHQKTCPHCIAKAKKQRTAERKRKRKLKKSEEERKVRIRGKANLDVTAVLTLLLQSKKKVTMGDLEESLKET